MAIAGNGGAVILLEHSSGGGGGGGVAVAVAAAVAVAVAGAVTVAVAENLQYRTDFFLQFFCQKLKTLTSTGKQV